MIIWVCDVDVDAGSGEPSARVDGVDTELVVLLLVEVQWLSDRYQANSLKLICFKDKIISTFFFYIGDFRSFLLEKML